MNSNEPNLSKPYKIINLLHIQVRYLVEFMYTGRIDRISLKELKKIEQVAGALGILGISASLKLPCEELKDEDEFSENAIDLSPKPRRVLASCAFGCKIQHYKPLWVGRKKRK